MTDTKFALYSKAFQWSVFSIILLAKVLFDIDITESDIEPIATAVTALVSAIYWLWWTIDRKKPIRFTP